jgi:Ca2+:H+ antiporter
VRASAAKPAASVARAALPFFLVFGTAGLFLLFDDQLLSPGLSPAISIAVFLWLFGAVVIGALMVVANADELAVILGEPYGTLILTLSVGSIEIMTIGTVMLTGEANPALARDTMFSVVMIVMNGLVGLALLLGGLRYHEQGYNFPGGQRLPRPHRRSEHAWHDPAELHDDDTEARSLSSSPCA